MIVCFAPRGGVGATSAAINIAANLVAQNRKVVIVDMELQLGAVCTSLNLRPNRSIAEIVMETIDQKGPITSALDQHSAGMTVLAQEDRINELSVITTDRLPRLFDALGCAFEYIIVDGLRSFSDHAVATMDLAHKILLFTTQDIPSIKSSTKVYRLLRKLGYPENKVNLVINRYQEKSEYSLEIIENYIGGTAQYVIHNDFPFVSQALSEALLFNQIDAQNQVAIDVANIANDLMGLAPIKKNSSFFSKLFRRS
jgi:pilus assembly protein CpaE